MTSAKYSYCLISSDNTFTVLSKEVKALIRSLDSLEKQTVDTYRELINKSDANAAVTLLSNMTKEVDRLNLAKERLARTQTSLPVTDISNITGRAESVISSKTRKLNKGKKSTSDINEVVSEAVNIADNYSMNIENIVESRMVADIKKSKHCTY